MSEWHMSWQKLFPHKNREVVIKSENEIHRADVLCFGTVIEFQHSPISKSEFSRRNKFYTDAGKKVVWIFDLTELYTGNDEFGRLFVSGDWRDEGASGSKFTWKHPWSCLEGFLPQYEKDVEVFIQTVPFGNNPKSEIADGYMEEVIWVDPSYKTSWGKFHTRCKIGNYSDLLNYLKARWQGSQSENNDDTKKQRKYKYQVDGRIIEVNEFEDFLYQNKPYHILEVGQRNFKFETTKMGQPHFWCPDPHQKPCIQEECCTLGCYVCLAVEEVSQSKRYIYCKHSFANGRKYESKYFKRIYE